MKFLKNQSNVGYSSVPLRRINRNANNPYLRRGRSGSGKAMNELGVCGRILTHSPDSDCNSNLRGSTSCLSNASSQDIDFIQDNSDYQWFLDYNYRDGSTNHHTSILSLSEAYDANELGYYNVLSKNLDANLAEADMESFRTEDIHALLTNLPVMCTDPLSQDSNRQGESFASVTGSMMAKFDFDSSISPHSSSQDSANSTSMSICKSELLFSPVKEVHMPGANFSVDSLDCELMTEHDIMLTCQANKDNYTIAFEGSMITYSEESDDYHDTDKSDSASGTGSTNWASNLKTQTENLKRLQSSMVQSDSGGFTTWSKLKKRSSDNQLRKHPSGNNNASEETGNRYNHTDNVLKSQSMPNLYKQKLKGMLVGGLKNQNLINSLHSSNIRRGPVKVFNIQHHIQQSSSLSGGSLISEMATSADGASSSSESNKQQPNFNLVKRFMKHKSMSSEAMDQSSNEYWHSHESLKHSTHDDKTNCFEDSLLVDQKTTETCQRTHNLIIEEQDEDVLRSESVEQLSESISKLDSISETSQHTNNNNGSNITYRLKTHSTQTKHNTSGSSLSSGSGSSSPSSFTPKHRKSISKATATQVPLQLMNKSMQTSMYLPKNLTNAPYKLNCNNTKDCVKIIEPTFLTKLKTEGETQKPVYILYPNYVLPDLQFLNEKQEDVAKVFLMPQRTRTVAAKSRPFSCNDVEALKRKGFSHVHDWESLNFLLPNEYKVLLADVPEISQKIDLKSEAIRNPSFCASPPVKRRVRPLSCDGGIVTDGTNVSSSSSTATQPSSGYRGSSTMLLTDSQNSPGPTANFNPLFVYRYDSVTSSEASLLNSDRQRPITTTAPPLPKRSISLSHERGRKGEIIPPRPPLPKGILRKSIENAKRKNEKPKRYSMFDMTENDIVEEVSQKRHSLQEQYYYQRNKRLSETEDEGVDAGTSSSSLDEQPEINTRIPRSDILLSNISCDEMVQLEEYLKMSGISSSDPEDLDEEGILQLRTCVSKFLSLKINHDTSGRKTVSFVVPKNFEMKPPNNSPNSSAFTHQRLVDMPICEEGENTPENYSSPIRAKKEAYHLNKKRLLISSVTDAIERLVDHFAPANNESDLICLGESAACAKIALTHLCPAIYAILSEGLKPNLETSFGPISNSVWQVVEASAQQGVLTKALNELVMRINSEDAITEGLVKFNAFIFGLLNVRSLDAWVSYLRTRESVLKKHYNRDSFLLLGHTGGAAVRELLDTLVSALEPLALLPFHFDLLFEYRQLHNSFKRMDSYQQPLSPTHHKLPNSPNNTNFRQWNLLKSVQSNSDSDEPTIRQRLPLDIDPSLPDLLNSSTSNKIQHKPDKLRPRSCVEPKASFKLGEDVASIAKRRWSGISLSSKLYQVYDRLAQDDTEEEYTDSLENNCAPQPPSLESNASDDKPLNGARFKKLQKKWEMLSGKDSSTSPPLSPSHTSKSKIPRPVISPLKPSGIPVPLLSPTTPGKNINKQSSVVKRTIPVVKSSASKKSTNVTLTRPSRVDQLDKTCVAIKHPPRPSSLPYKPTSVQPKTNKGTPPRRAVSSSIGRKSEVQSQTTRIVRTLGHRLPSESGHLSYNQGELLKVILEVDDKWLLCCRGTQKGLVPRAAVITDHLRL